MTDKFQARKQIFVSVYGHYSSVTDAKYAITGLLPELKKNRPWVVKMRGNTLIAMN